jgi:alpha-L-glutamate ligase-like protein
VTTKGYAVAIKPSHILGHNGRYKYTALNSDDAKKYGFSKLRTKELLREHSIPTAEVYHVFETHDDIDIIQWENIPVPFVIKPASGSAGKGVWVITKKIEGQSIWVDTQNEQLDAEDLSLHVSNILDGEFSTWGTNHKAIVEEMIVPHPKLGKLSYSGTPDIRVIIFNSVPIMAMARIPTKESQGKANLDQGAIALGVDIASGITIHGVHGKKKIIKNFPDKPNKKVTGIVIPYWQDTLLTAVKAANAAGFVFMGADLFIHEEKGPMVVELNGFPGLSIQLANEAGLKRRLERVEGLDVRNAKHGVKIGQSLFAEIFVDEIRAEKGLQIIPYKPTIQVFDDKKQPHIVGALINTSRYRSAISQDLAEELGHYDIEDMLWRQQEIEGKVPVVEVTFKLEDREIKTAMVVVKRLNRTQHKIELGRRDVQGFLVGEMEG